MTTPSDAAQRATQIASDLIEADRASVAGEIHDALVPYLFAASAGLSRLKSDARKLADTESASRLDQVAGLVDQAMKISRQILASSYPPELIGNVWTRAAIDTIERLFVDEPVVIQWRLVGDVDQVTPPVSLVCYRIVVEAVRNAVRHGKSSHVEIVGQRADQRHVITITDDGIGFDPKCIPSGHYGIKSMLGRAEMVGGELSIQSARGGPTQIRLSIPASVSEPK